MIFLKILWPLVVQRISYKKKEKKRRKRKMNLIEQVTGIVRDIEVSRETDKDMVKVLITIPAEQAHTYVSFFFNDFKKGANSARIWLSGLEKKLPSTEYLTHEKKLAPDKAEKQVREAIYTHLNSLKDKEITLFRQRKDGYVNYLTYKPVVDEVVADEVVAKMEF